MMFPILDRVTTFRLDSVAFPTLKVPSIAINNLEHRGFGLFQYSIEQIV